MTTIMLDSDVLIDALQGINGDKGDNARAAAALVGGHDRFVVSSVTFFEVLNSTDETRATCLKRLRLDERPVVKPVAELAASIAQRARSEPSWCDNCWGMMPIVTCKKCKGQSSQQQKTNDMLIIATAEINRVAFLYSRDSGMHNLAKFVTTTKVLHPPAAAEQLELSNTVRLPKPKRKRTR